MYYIPFFNIESVRLFGRLWIFGCLLMTITGCGDAGQSSSEHQERTSVGLSVHWHAPEQSQATESDTVTKGALSASCADLGIDTVQFMVYDAEKRLLESSPPWLCTDREGEAMSIKPGTDRHFVVLGRDTQGDIIYHGQSTETILPGEEKTVNIEAYAFIATAPDKAAAYDTRIQLTWNAVDERAGIAGYRVHYDKAGSEPVHASSIPWVVEDLTASTNYCFTVSAEDGFGNVSKKSDAVCADTTNRICDTNDYVVFDHVTGEDGEYDINPISYTKFDAEGKVLVNQADFGVTVRDNVTGLVWEVKTDPDNDSQHPYRHSGTLFKWDAIEEQFIDKLNEERFGGYTTWRLPSRIELLTLVDFGSPGKAIVHDFFPNSTSSGAYWTSTQSADSGNACRIAISNGNLGFVGKDQDIKVRAVYGEPKSMVLVDNGDNTVTDKSTGLMWVQFGPHLFGKSGDTSLVDSDGNAVGLSWTEALATCERLNFAGHSDWRLPNVKETLSIIGEPYVDVDTLLQYFPNTPPQDPHSQFNPHYWTSTTSAYIPANGTGAAENHAWKVDIYRGNAHPQTKNDPYHVRAVRSAFGNPAQAE